jgi:uridine monophosphate synthetase
VVGATDIPALAEVRGKAPDLWFLAPGVGEQGGEVGPAVTAGVRADGLGMLIPVSRGIARAVDAAAAARRLRDEINQQRAAAAPNGAGEERERSANDLVEIGCVRSGVPAQVGNRLADLHRSALPGVIPRRPERPPRTRKSSRR